MSETAHPHGVRHDTGPQGPVCFWIAALVAVFAPMVRGGNRPLPLAVLECAGIALILVCVLAPTRPPLANVPRLLRWAAGLTIGLPLLQLVPVPVSWWAALPGHEAFARVLDFAGEDAGWRAITIHSTATQYAWLALLPCVGMFLAIQQLDRHALRRLATVFVAMACFEALLGLLQAGSTPGSAINFGNPYGGAGATGTYVNKNHFAALMAMALPMLLALWAIEMLPVVTHRGEVLRDHPRNRDVRFALRALFSALMVVMLLALILSRSRAGIAAGLLAFGLAVLMLVWKSATPQVKVALAIVGAGAMLFGAYVGLTPVLERFAPDAFSLEYRSRAGLAMSTLRAALDFMPLGSGLGTFADVFRRYQDARIVGFVDHAHNDYAEAILELGIAGVAAIALSVAAYFLRWRSVVAQRASRRLRFLQTAAGLGMLAMIVHAAFDFNFHIPGNAVSFSLLAGIFFFTPAADRA